jgi:hypothetical protein
MPLWSGIGESVRYLEFYYHCARPMLSTNFDNDFWSRTTLRLASSEPAVRHALIALGYLTSTESGSLRHARSRFAGQRESGVLLHHYNKSVRALLDRMDNTTHTPEVELVTCLLFVCMEYLRGNYHAAYTHLINGQKIILELREEKKRRDSSLSLSSESTTSAATTAASCTSTLIEEELEPMFTRALASAMMYGVRYQLHIPPLQELTGIRFQNMREAQIHAHELRNRSILHLFRMGRRSLESPEAPFTAEELLENELLLSCQRAWYIALESYRIKHQLSDADALVISAMLMHHHITNIWVRCCKEINETLFDDHLETFKTILHHAELVLNAMDLNATQPVAKFTFEISVIPSLSFVATRCRCPITRRKALALLARNPPREGLWDAEQHFMMARRAIELEEQDLDPTTGWPVEEARLWSAVVAADMNHKGGFWASFQPVTWVHERTSAGMPKILQEYFVWYVRAIRPICGSKSDILLTRCQASRYLQARKFLDDYSELNVHALANAMKQANWNGATLAVFDLWGVTPTSRHRGKRCLSQQQYRRIRADSPQSLYRPIFVLQLFKPISVLRQKRHRYLCYLMEQPNDLSGATLSVDPATRFLEQLLIQFPVLGKGDRLLFMRE